MKNLNDMQIKHTLIALLGSLLLASCDWGSYDDLPADDRQTFDVIVTIKQDADGQTYFQVNDSTVAYPETPYPFENEVRAMGMMNIRPTGKKGLCSCNVHWLEPLDKGTVIQDHDGIAQEGIDPVNSWMTCVEDGYLTVHYKTWWALAPLHHELYLVTGANPEDPYEVELRHDAHKEQHDVYADGIVYFDLSTLPDTGDETRKLTLTWRSTQGEMKKATFDYKTRK